jgi:hypothetical protein
VKKRALACLLLGCLPSFGLDVGFDFRATQSFVTDPAYAVFSSNTNYPTTLSVNSQLITFGWESQSAGFLTRDRGASGDPRLAGVSCQLNDGTTSVFRVDLPSSGTYSIGLAAGDGFGFDESNHLTVGSGGASLFSVNLFSPANRFADSTGSLWSVSAWPGSNMAVQKAFGSTILRLTLGGTVDSAFSCLAHLRVTSVHPAAPIMTSAWQFFIL